ncbi:MAG: glucosidase [Acidimicrobiia bacterium]|nr:glucosidase [Acidimicrobiia bacterium]
MTAEHERLAAGDAWKRWGPYLAERAWGTVREDYSEDGDAWASFTHDEARSRAYRWNEDGLLGISDDHQYLCFSPVVWNGADPILKERLFGLTNAEGNHGEDAKELYWFLDSTPTHSYMRARYRYPHAEFPYADLVAENQRRSFDDPEYELADTGVFDEDRYFDVDVEYAKGGPDDTLIRLTVHNRGPEPATIHLAPTLWFRNTWAWGYPAGPMRDVPGMPAMENVDGTVEAVHPAAGTYRLAVDGEVEWLFTDNDTDYETLYGTPNRTPHTKGAFHRYLVGGDSDAINPDATGTKSCAYTARQIPGGGVTTLRLRLSPDEMGFDDFDAIFSARVREADEFYAAVQPPDLGEAERSVHRQAMAGLMWTKQLYYYDIDQWLNGDPGADGPPETRQKGRNHSWGHLNNFDIISMPDSWEYPWYAVWDLAFHCVPLARIDPGFAKEQLELFTRVWYMHPDGQMPAYEWGLGDTNPPVHAWAALRVFEIDGATSGEPDFAFLQRIFHKLLMNFTWWVNRKDRDGNNVFQGGFLGLDNISLFDRSTPLDGAGHLDQSDGTAWMGFYTLTMLHIALELSDRNPVYQDLATKFFEHFLAIAYAVNDPDAAHPLWDANDRFFYDVLHAGDDVLQLTVRSLVGLMPLLAVHVLEEGMLADHPEFKDRLEWFEEHRPGMASNIASIDLPGVGSRRLLSLLDRDKLEAVLGYMLDETEFLSPYGVRSLSAHHRDRPYRIEVSGAELSIGYEPAESRSGLYGGNSNWRGPVWFPINFLLIESLRAFERYYGDDLTVEFPTGSGTRESLGELADDLARRLVGLFMPDAEGVVPSQPPGSSDGSVLFFEYFNGDDGRGLGASHQTGWTALVAELIVQLADERPG